MDFYCSEWVHRHIFLLTSFQFVAALYQEKPVLVDISDGNVKRTVLPAEEGDDDANDKASSYVTAVAWNKTGSRIYAGTSKGHLNVIHPSTQKVRRF